MATLYTAAWRRCDRLVGVFDRLVDRPLTARVCVRIDGSGHAIAQSRALDAFDLIEVSAGLQAAVSIGPEKAVVSGDDNIVPLVLTTVQNGLLRIEPEHSFEPVVPLRIEVRTPSVREASLRAGGQLELNGIDADALTLSGEAGGDIVASGSVRREVSTASGGTVAYY
jgi:hypothetical protein